MRVTGLAGFAAAGGRCKISQEIPILSGALTAPVELLQIRFVSDEVSHASKSGITRSGSRLSCVQPVRMRLKMRDE